MIKVLKHKDREYPVLLGFDALNTLKEGQKQGKDELEIIRDVTIKGIQVYARREGEDVLKKEDLECLFDDIDFFFDAQEVVEDFSVNFMKKAETRMKKRAKK